MQDLFKLPNAMESDCAMEIYSMLRELDILG